MDFSIHQNEPKWQNVRVPARGYPAHGFPTLLDPLQSEEHHEPEPLPPFKPGPPPHPGKNTPPSCTSLGRREGKRSWLWAVWEYHEPGPLSSRDPLPLLTKGSILVHVGPPTVL